MKHPKPSKKIRVVAAVVVLSTLTALGFWYYESSSNVLAGVVEATLVPQTMEVPGKLLEVSVEPGQQVKKDDVLAVIDSTDQEYALTQLQFTLVRKQAALTELEKGTKSETIRQAENSIDMARKNYNSARTVHDQSAADLKNANELFRDGAISKTAYDQAVNQEALTRNAMSSAGDQLDSALKALSLLQGGAGEEKITQARADVELTQTQIRQAEQNMEKFTIRASADGTVISRNYVAGDVVNPGYNLADISDEAQRYVVAYLPERALGTVEYGQKLQFEAEGKTYEAAVSYIDIQAQYTPKDMQTTANKNQDSFKIKLLLDADSPLKPGQKVKVFL